MLENAKLVVKIKELEEEKNSNHSTLQYSIIMEHLEKVATNTVSFGIIHTGYGVGRFYPFFVQAFFIRDYREIPECILLCMFLCKSRLFKIYEYHCWYNAETYT